MPDVIYKKAKINPKAKSLDIPAEIKMMIKTLDLIYELDAQSPNPLKDNVIFSI